MKNKSILYIVLTALCFGTMEIALKLGGNAFTPLQLTFLRFLIGGLFLLPFAIRDAKKRGLKLTAGDVGYLALLGVTGVCLSMTLFQLGVMRCNANTAAVVISTNPVFTMLFAWLILHDAFTWRKAIVLIVSVLGLVFVANPLNMAEGNTAAGVALVAVAAVLFGLYTALGKKRVAKLGGMVQNAGSFLIASVVELAVLLLKGEPVVSGLSGGALPVLLYTGVVVTGVGYFAYLRAIELAGPSNASIAFFIKPVIAVILAALILSEPITWNVVVGVALVLTGSIINLTAKKAQKA